MAIAGRVAIVPKGEWSQDVTYDKLDLVTHNGNTFIAYKSSVGVEPVDGDTWMLVMQGIDPQDIENIIDGTTPVGDSEKLGGKNASEYALGTDLANYLPKNADGSVGGGLISLKLKGDYSANYLQFLNSSGTTFGILGFNGANKPVFRNTSNVDNELLHSGNKPTGTYTGTATERSIPTGGIDHAIIIRTNGSFSIVSPQGAIIASSSGVTYVDGSTATFANGVLILKTDNASLNANGVSYSYQVL
jgi:hypothetical protein